MGQQSAASLRAHASALAEFEDSLRHFLGLCERTTLARGILPAVFPRDGLEPGRYSEAQRRVEVASGRASSVTALTGSRYGVEGIGVVDPIIAWATITRPKPVLDPEDILAACGQMAGKLDQMIAEAEARAFPAIQAEEMHPLVWGAARSMWRDGYYREAVLAAAESLVGQLKARTGRYATTDTALWQETFSEREPLPGRPRLRWPGDPNDRTVKSMNEGLRAVTAGVQMTVRNPATHSTEPLTLVEGSERLAVLSLIARWVESCVLVEASTTDD